MANDNPSRQGGQWQVPFRLRLRPLHGVVLILLLAVMLSALAVIGSAYQTRAQYARLQQLESDRDRLQTTWSRLLLEESTWSTPSRIENLARQRLDMHVPGIENTRVMRP
ncbi:cell division protein FtsL [Kushneria aurantia]|uniref:Cell division protein FtsL n=1 Tax=Kushneria aurantia TaxID=504092 RepID=A0ABV6FZW8_9GAMM|nr:cell division protein FtsL [Kushneria aurantia]